MSLSVHLNNRMTENNKNILVTGATGFVGSRLVMKLVDEGWNVNVVVRPKSNLQQIDELKKKITIHVFDGQIECLIDIFSKSKPLIVFHLASLFIAEHQPSDVKQLIDSNVLFGAQLIEAMFVNDCKFLINTGTSWQHMDNEPYKPVCLYAATKQAFDTILDYYVDAHNFHIYTLSLFDTYGPKDPRKKLFYLLNRYTESNDSLAMSPGEQLIDLVYIDDVIEAFIIAGELLLNSKSKRDKTEFAVSSKNPIQLKELVKVYESVVGKKVSINWGQRQYRMREVMVPWNDGKILPGWSPKVNLQNGIKMISNKH